MACFFGKYLRMGNEGFSFAMGGRGKGPMPAYRMGGMTQARYGRMFRKRLGDRRTCLQIVADRRECPLERRIFRLGAEQAEDAQSGDLRLEERCDLKGFHLAYAFDLLKLFQSCKRVLFSCSAKPADLV